MKRYIPVLILVLLIDAAHQSSGRRQDILNEDEDGLLWGELDALADNIDELTHGQVRRHQILLLIDGGDVAFFHLLADDLLEKNVVSDGFPNTYRISESSSSQNS